MKILRTSISSALLFTALGIALGLTYSWVADMQRRARSQEIHMIFLERCKYRQQLLAKVKSEVNPIMNQLHHYSRNPEEIQMNDSVKSLIQESFLALMKCDRALYEVKELAFRDSTLLEMSLK